MKTLKYCENYQNMTQDMKWANAARKMSPIDLLDVRDATNLQFPKKTQYL